MADESSEGRRYSYKKKPQYNKKLVKRTVTKEKPKPRYKAKGGDIHPKQKPPSKAHETDNKPKTVRHNAPTVEMVPRWLEFRRRAELENVQRRRFPQDRGPRLPIDDRSANPPERRPHPMIEPLNNTLLPQQLRSQAAHNYGFTPEAYREMRQVPINVEPVTPDTEGFHGAYTDPGFDDRGERIDLISTNNGAIPSTLAHEQAHAWWGRRGFQDDAIIPGYDQAFNRWRDESPNNPASRAQNEYTHSGQYPLGQNPFDSTELHARTVQFDAGPDHSEYPDYVRPYYSGFLQGMDRLSTGEPTPPPARLSPEEQDILTPDENGMYGYSTPQYGSRLYRDWR